MISWPAPSIPTVPGSGLPVRVYDSSTGSVRPIAPGPVVRMYVCGITPYDATHVGHAATYVTFDVLGRALRDGGRQVDYVQNVTDVDDPLLERARRDGIPWSDLAASEIGLFREDMTALGVIPPDHYIGVVESIDSVAAAVEALLDKGIAYRLPSGEDGVGDDVYFDLAQSEGFGTVSSWSREQMMAVFEDRGGDPGRAGKHDPLDPLLWRAARPGEPAWPHERIGAGRPGWHIECTAIALDYLGMAFDVQGGGTDLIFPHHEMTAVQATGLTGERPFAHCYVHQAMVGLHGEKMSKSKGNLVLVSRLRADGVDPMAIRLVLLAQHYRTPWDWTDELLRAGEARLAAWRAALSAATACDATATVAAIRAAVGNDLDTPAALRAVDSWAHQTTPRGGQDPDAPELLAGAVDALLGVRLFSRG